jgi:Domain of unknown function (DUF4332)
MGYKIADIEEIGLGCGSKLSKAVITATSALLEHCGGANGRRPVAAACGLDGKQLLKWPNMTDLMRIRAIGKQFSELLEAPGVNPLKELRTLPADHLASKMKQANAKRKLTRAVPAEGQVAGWIKQAKSMDGMIAH